MKATEMNEMQKNLSGDDSGGGDQVTDVAVDAAAPQTPSTPKPESFPAMGVGLGRVVIEKASTHEYGVLVVGQGGVPIERYGHETVRALEQAVSSNCSCTPKLAKKGRAELELERASRGIALSPVKAALAASEAVARGDNELAWCAVRCLVGGVIPHMLHEFDAATIPLLQRLGCCTDRYDDWLAGFMLECSACGYEIMPAADAGPPSPPVACGRSWLEMDSEQREAEEVAAAKKEAEAAALQERKAAARARLAVREEQVRAQQAARAKHRQAAAAALAQRKAAALRERRWLAAERARIAARVQQARVQQAEAAWRDEEAATQPLWLPPRVRQLLARRRAEHEAGLQATVLSRRLVYDGQRRWLAARRREHLRSGWIALSDERRRRRRRCDEQAATRLQAAVRRWSAVRRRRAAEAARREERRRDEQALATRLQAVVRRRSAVRQWRARVEAAVAVQTAWRRCGAVRQAAGAAARRQQGRVLAERSAARRLQAAMRRRWDARVEQSRGRKEQADVAAALAAVEARAATTELDSVGAPEGMVLALCEWRTVGTDTELDTLREKGVRIVRHSGGKQRRKARWRRQQAGEAAARAALWLEDARRLDEFACAVGEAA